MGGEGREGVKDDSDVSNLRGCLVLLAHERMEKLDGSCMESETPKAVRKTLRGIGGVAD